MECLISTNKGRGENNLTIFDHGGGGQGASVLAFYSNDPSLKPANV